MRPLLPVNSPFLKGISCLWFFNIYMVKLHCISAQCYVRLGLHLRPPNAGLPERIRVLFDMPGPKHCSDYVKGMLTLLHKQGHSNREMSWRLGISKGIVCYNITKCVETGLMARAAGSGRLRKTDARGDRFMKMVWLQNKLLRIETMYGRTRTLQLSVLVVTLCVEGSLRMAYFGGLQNASLCSPAVIKQTPYDGLATTPTGQRTIIIQFFGRTRANSQYLVTESDV